MYRYVGSAGSPLRSGVRFRVQTRRYSSPFDTPLGQKPPPAQSRLSVIIGDAEDAYGEVTAVISPAVFIHAFFFLSIAVAAEWLSNLPLLVLGLSAVVGSAVGLQMYGKDRPRRRSAGA
jgi:hypothetical protein